MLCPYCVREVEVFEATEKNSEKDSLSDGLSDQASGSSKANERGQERSVLKHRCPHCGETVPSMYVNDYRRFPPLVATGVGFTGHGKTVYFASLFHALRHDLLASLWPQFFTLALDEESLRAVLDNMAILNDGRLPAATPVNFSRPTLLRLANVPTLRDATLAIYDLSGETFANIAQREEYTQYVSRARTALFLVCIPELMQVEGAFSLPVAMEKLLNNYIARIANIGGDTHNQRLLVVYTKADVLSDYLKHESWEALRNYVSAGPFEGLGSMRVYMARLKYISTLLEDFTERGVKARMFMNMAREHFRGVDFCMVSALGAAPNGNHLTVRINPSRVLDPLLTIMAMAPEDFDSGHESTDSDPKPGGGCLPGWMRFRKPGR